MKFLCIHIECEGIKSIVFYYIAGCHTEKEELYTRGTMKIAKLRNECNQLYQKYHREDCKGSTCGRSKSLSAGSENTKDCLLEQTNEQPRESCAAKWIRIFLLSK